MLSLPDFTEKSLVCCYTTEGQKVAFKNDNLILKDEEENILLQKTCHTIFALWLIGPVSVTSGILERSKKFGFSVSLLNFNHRLMGQWSAAVDGNFLLRKKQYDYSSDDIAKHLIYNKIKNQTTLLKSIRSKSEEEKNAVKMLENYLENIGIDTDSKSLLGLEGSASRVFFGTWFANMEWKGRKPRTKIDPINTLLDIGYTYLFNFMESMLNLYGFDLFQGVYHKNFYQRKSLVCDLVEPFRCIIDKQILKAYNLKQFQMDDFDCRKGQYFLKINKSKDYSKWLLQSILANKEEIFTYTQQYYRAFMRNKAISEYPTFDIHE